MMTQDQISKLTKGDKIIYEGEVGTFSYNSTHQRTDGVVEEYWFDWEVGGCNWLGAEEVMQQCTLVPSESIEITEKMIEIVLDAYYSAECGTYHNKFNYPSMVKERSAVIESIKKKIDVENEKNKLKQDPEFKEYLRLKEKFKNV